MSEWKSEWQPENIKQFESAVNDMLTFGMGIVKITYPQPQVEHVFYEDFLLPPCPKSDK